MEFTCRGPKVTLVMKINLNCSWAYCVLFESKGFLNHIIGKNHKLNKRTFLQHSVASKLSL